MNSEVLGGYVTMDGSSSSRMDVGMYIRVVGLVGLVGLAGLVGLNVEMHDEEQTSAVAKVT